MPILQDSGKTRDAMQGRNLYQPEDPYAINQDILSKTLDVFQSAGFDMRSSLAVNILERVVDNTPLVRDGAERLVIEMGRRLAVNLFHENVGTLDVDAVFSKDPKRKILTKHVDMRITPIAKTGTIGDFVKNGLDVNRPTTVLDRSMNGNTSTDRERELGGYNLYLHLGKGQKAILQEQQGQNFYQNYPVANSELGDGYSLNTDGYDFNWLLQRRADSIHSSYILDGNKNKLNDTFGRSIQTLTESMQLHDERLTIADTEGFGRTDLGLSDDGLNDITRFLRYSETDDTIDSDFGLKRGLVYYTQQIAKTNTKVGNAIRSNTIEYGTSDGQPVRQDESNVEWKGSSECRSFTMANQYGTFGTKVGGTGNLMRWNGNFNPDSVLEKSVMPNIVRGVDKRPQMLSLENLAWSEGDIKELPLNEQGPNNGRIMWFPPYGLTISEQESPKWDKTEFIGRVEPVYSYNGTERKGTLSFVILIDTPPELDDYQNRKFDLGSFFAGCEAQQRKEDAINNPQGPIKRPKAPVRDTQRYGGKYVSLYFQNDSDSYDNAYEITGSQTNNVPDVGTDLHNAYSLNKAFVSDENDLTQWMSTHYKEASKDYSIVVNIEASSSALFKSNYNAALSFRRAHELMNKLLLDFNAASGESLTIKQPSPTKSSYATTITTKSIKKPITFLTNNDRIKFIITGTGESYLSTPSNSDQESELNNREAKIVRKATIKKVVATSLKTPDETQANIDLKAYNTAASQSNTANLTGVLGTKAPMGAKFNKIEDNGVIFPSGWNKIDYYKPVFHSQTPYDFYKRYTFLHQLSRPGHTINVEAQVGANSLFGRMPMCVLRIGDFFHTKVAINSIQFDMTETTWDMNPEGMGMQPMYCKITMDIDIIGGMSLKGPINRLQTAVDNNFLANSTFGTGGHYPKDRKDFGEEPLKPNFLKP